MNNEKVEPTAFLIHSKMTCFNVLCVANKMQILLLLLCFLNTSIILHKTKTKPLAVATQHTNNSDRDALLAFKKSIVYDPLGVMRSWNNSMHFCKWEGVTCSRRHVRATVLNLTSRGLGGLLPPHVGNLSFLKILSLLNNSFHGQIPPELGHLRRLNNLVLRNNSFEGNIPGTLSHCTNLIRLRLSYNKLIGKIPKELGQLRKLTFLDFYANNLTGGISPFLGNLTSLETLSLGVNKLEGTIPEALGRLRNLKALGLGSNGLHGMIPTSIYNLSSITIFSIDRNHFHGTLPSNIGLTLPNLEWFQIQQNHFSGPLPISLSNATHLELLELGYSNFTGEILVDFGGLQNLRKVVIDNTGLGGDPGGMNFIKSLSNCTKLEILEVQTNQLAGILPKEIGNLSSTLTYLDLGENEISGFIPPEIGNLVKLGVLSLEINHMVGPIPKEIGLLQSLQILSLVSNKLSGNIPTSLGNLSLLNKLSLWDNALQGNIPSELGDCGALMLMDLSLNNLSGSIPKQIFGILALSILLDLSGNQLVGTLPFEIGNLGHLAGLDLSKNHLSGELPSTLGSCTSLVDLQLSENLFSGAIPESLSSLRGIQNLDLSRNNLSGHIPKFLESFLLDSLNLSFNNFEGEVPLKGVFLNPSAVSLVGNYRLCGGISKLHLPKCNSTSGSKKRKVLHGHMVLILIGGVIFIAFVVSSFLLCQYRRRAKLKKQPSSMALLGESLLQVSYRSLLKATNGFSLENMVGRGSFGTVYRGILGESNTSVAIKVFNLQCHGAFKSFLAECEAMRNIRHRNLVKIITACSSIDLQGNDFKALVFEFVTNGSLENWLHPSPQTDGSHIEIRHLNILQRVNVAIDIACALSYLHHQSESPIVHCDLKPSNILLDDDMTARVADFGLARFLLPKGNDGQSSSIGLRGTIGYAPPEYGLGSEITIAGDIYSYGILLLEMITAKRPTDTMFSDGFNLHKFAMMALPNRIIDVVDPILVHSTSNSCKMECVVSLIKIGIGCSMDSPQERMTISNVLKELHFVRDMLLRDAKFTHLK